jgi:hypothetical protein
MAARDRVVAGGGGEEKVVLARKDGSRFHAATTSGRVDARRHAPGLRHHDP